MLTALNTDGIQPFKYATMEATDMLDEVEASEAVAGEKGGPASRLCAQKLARFCGHRG
jgi:hypothetical protein